MNTFTAAKMGNGSRKIIGFQDHAPAKSKSSSAFAARVIPQPGQGIPVNARMGQRHPPEKTSAVRITNAAAAGTAERNVFFIAFSFRFPSSGLQPGRHRV